MIGPKLASQYDIWVFRRDLMATSGDKVNITFLRNGQKKEASFVLEQKL
jgi:hypothetical protein